jgi:glucosamine-phosphate N-acetyltransferase
MIVRKLAFKDYESYHVLINDFRPTVFTKEQFQKSLEYIQQTGDIWVLEEDGILFATGTIFYEKKLIFDTCIYAHIEDVCVTQEQRGKGYGKQIVRHLLEESKRNGCHKVTLDCNDANVGFYISCGLTKRGNQMCELIQYL